MSQTNEYRIDTCRYISYGYGKDWLGQYQDDVTGELGHDVGSLVSQSGQHNSL